MYLPALYPTLVRATGRGSVFNFGRIFAAGGALVFVFVAQNGTVSPAIVDHRIELQCTATLFIQTAIAAWLMPEEQK